MSENTKKLERSSQRCIDLEKEATQSRTNVAASDVFIKHLLQRVNGLTDELRTADMRAHYCETLLNVTQEAYDKAFWKPPVKKNSLTQNETKPHKIGRP
jgi:hypothetical protein